MNRITDIETQYGCLVADETPQNASDSWPVRLKNHLFKKENLGAVDLHDHDYEKPSGNPHAKARWVPGYFSPRRVYFSHNENAVITGEPEFEEWQAETEVDSSAT